MRESLGGMAGWLLGRLRGRQVEPPRLAVVERVSLAPRQSLALVEAEGRRILVATSAEGGPAFYPLDGAGREAEGARTARSAGRGAAHRQPRISW